MSFMKVVLVMGRPNSYVLYIYIYTCKDGSLGARGLVHIPDTRIAVPTLHMTKASGFTNGLLYVVSGCSFYAFFSACN